MHVLTLVAEGLDASGLVEETRSLLIARGLEPRERPLDPERAVDLLLDRPVQDPEDLLGELRGRAASHGADLALQTTENRRKRLLVADMESTIIRNEMLDELADVLGIRDRIAAITARAMNGELDFEAALDERVGLLKGLEVDALDACAEKIEIDPGARTLVTTLKAHGVFTALVSGGFTYFADPIAERLGFDAVQANRLGIADGRLTGSVERPILDREAKVTALHAYCDRLGLEPRDAVTVGDGANDLPMLTASGLGVAYHGKPAVAAAARYRIDHGDLRTLLYFQGYTADELRP